MMKRKPTCRCLENFQRHFEDFIFTSILVFDRLHDTLSIGMDDSLEILNVLVGSVILVGCILFVSNENLYTAMVFMNDSASSSKSNAHSLFNVLALNFTMTNVRILQVPFIMITGGVSSL